MYNRRTGAVSSMGRAGWCKSLRCWPGMIAGTAELIPAWIAAVATAGAVVVAFTVFRSDLNNVAGRTLNIKLGSLTYGLLRQWMQEEKVAGQPLTTTGLSVGVRISNASGQSVRGVDGRITYGGKDLEPVFMFGDIGPTAPDFGSRRMCEFPMSRLPDDVDVTLQPNIVKGLLASYSFTDASGNRWHRTNVGELRYLYNLSGKKRRWRRVMAWVGGSPGRK